ncbi:hypothetical protein [Parasitella parasitica]|uniref:Uncharacterized protein n=1 Tax=Parasitella parasitica TaxID=35722 RepID=A0A0B7NQG2_9FUNG|nr:hypothetical protein [Parasitella parasitica]
MLNFTVEETVPDVAATEKFVHLATFYGEDGVLDLQKAELPRRFNKHFQNETRGWHKFALAASFEIWSTNSLLNKKHGEDWYRMHVYSNLLDKVFLDDNEFETKRSECVSQVMKVLKETEKDVKLQKLDFILRDLNTDNDIVTVEEKPSLKGVKADIKKGQSLKKHALYLWSKKVGSDVLMEQLEAISCQWQGTKFTIYGSRLLSSGEIFTYKKGVFGFPISIKHLPEFSQLLMAIISLKRIVKLNYAKFILILEEKYKQEIERLNFSEDSLNEISFVSNSTNSDCESEEEGDQDDKDDGDFVERIKEKLDQMKPDEQGLKKFSDWEVSFNRNTVWVWQDVIFEFLWPTTTIIDIKEALLSLDFSDIWYSQVKGIRPYRILLITLSQIWLAHMRFVFDNTPLVPEAILVSVRSTVRQTVDEDNIHSLL